jgi:hypothetical protein
MKTTNDTPSPPTAQHTASTTTSTAYRCKLTAVTAVTAPTTSHTYATAVFFTPAGRESEYMFTFGTPALQQ